MEIRVGCSASRLTHILTHSPYRLMELQVFTTLIVNKFSFEPDVEVTFAPLQISIVPVVEGKYDEGTQVPLKIKALLE